MNTRQIVASGRLALLLAIGLPAVAAQGQEVVGALAAPEVKPPLFPLLFPHPTHNNGYEEWVQAVDLIRSNASMEALFAAAEPTLAMKRRVLSDPAVEQALLLVRAGLRKPVYSPRATVEENTTFPELTSQTASK